MDTKVSKWRGWLKQIEREVSTLATNKYIFWGLQNMVQNNPKIQKGSYFYEFLGKIYGDSSIMGIRRQIKVGDDSVSLSGLLTEIVENPQKITRALHADLYTTVPRERAEQYFDEWSERGQDHISVTMVIRDLGELKNRARLCETWADKRVAHFDKTKPSSIPRFADIDESIDFIEQMFLKYDLILNAHGYVNNTLVPTFVDDWMSIFREPWLPGH